MQSILHYFQALLEATSFTLLSALWSFHCPLSPPQEKINSFNYLLVVLKERMEMGIWVALLLGVWLRLRL